MNPFRSVLVFSSAFYLFAPVAVAQSSPGGGTQTITFPHSQLTVTVPNAEGRWELGPNATVLDNIRVETLVHFNNRNQPDVSVGFFFSHVSGCGEVFQGMPAQWSRERSYAPNPDDWYPIMAVSPDRTVVILCAETPRGQLVVTSTLLPGPRARETASALGRLTGHAVNALLDAARQPPSTQTTQPTGLPALPSIEILIPDANTSPGRSSGSAATSVSSAPSPGTSATPRELVLPNTGLHVDFPSDGTAWEVAPNTSSVGSDLLRRSEPSQPLLYMLVHRVQNIEDCNGLIDRVATSSNNRHRVYRPDYLPPEWHPEVIEWTQNQLSMAAMCTSHPGGMLAVTVLHQGPLSLPDTRAMVPMLTALRAASVRQLVSLNTTRSPATNSSENSTDRTTPATSAATNSNDTTTRHAEVRSTPSTVQENERDQNNTQLTDNNSRRWGFELRFMGNYSNRMDAGGSVHTLGGQLRIEARAPQAFGFGLILGAEKLHAWNGPPESVDARYTAAVYHSMHIGDASGPRAIIDPVMTIGFGYALFTNATWFRTRHVGALGLPLGFAIDIRPVPAVGIGPFVEVVPYLPISCWYVPQAYGTCGEEHTRPMMFYTTGIAFTLTFR